MLGETSYYYPETVFCRRQAARNAFGDLSYIESHYAHHVDAPRSNLREIKIHRMKGQAGAAWIEKEKDYLRRGCLDGPMHYPTHSTSIPISIFGEPLKKVSCFGQRAPEDEYFAHGFSNQIALYQTASQKIARCCETRRLIFRGPGTAIGVFGSKAGFDVGQWRTLGSAARISPDEMREDLPQEVLAGYKLGAETLMRFKNIGNLKDGYEDEDLMVEKIEKAIYGGHAGSHAYLIHEFIEAITQDRHPAINIWEAVRYMAAGVAAHQSALRDGETMDVADWGSAK
jgi:hypothetical protein